MKPTTDDLKREYKTSQLWRAGISMEHALNEPLIRFGLSLAARARRTPRQPEQLKLI